MTKSELFKAAHKLTKEIIKAGDNYQATFGLCLKYIRKNGLPKQGNGLLEQVCKAVKATPVFANSGMANFGTVRQCLIALGEDPYTLDKKFARKLLSYVHPDKPTGDAALSAALNEAWKEQKDQF